ncbi:uncharacterized protein LOC126234836 [Schistocerca nitens]|uniref:uncharacterized protein LOC126234836 n=1 Tax=Schistocerca nitens TaxID=7011 RepID=UPI002118E546|nr:uncharacterized protein LOC126234836 [Schistocerca nitens]
MDFSYCGPRSQSFRPVLSRCLLSMTPEARRRHSLMPLRELLSYRGADSQNAANTTVIVILDSLEPYVFVKNGSTLPTGYLVDAWNILQDNLQFRSEYRVMRYPVGQQVVAAGKADVLLQPTVITSSDLNEMTFSRHILSIWYELYVKAAETQETWQAYVGACSSGAWLAAAATLLLLMLARRLCPQAGGDRSLGSCFVSVVGSVTSQGLQGRGGGGGGGGGGGVAPRLLSLLTLGAGLLLSGAYSAVLTSRLTVIVAPLPFRSLHELPETGSHALCVRKNNYAYLMFKYLSDLVGYDSWAEEDVRLLQESELAPHAVPRWRAVLERRPCANVWRDEDVARVMCEEHVALLEVEAVAARAMLLRAANRSLSLPSCRLRRVDSLRYAQSSAAFQMRRGFRLAPLINNS